MKRLINMLCLGAALLGLHACRQPDMMTRTQIFKVLGPDGTETSAISIDGKAQAVAFTILSTSEWNAQVSGTDDFSLSNANGGSGKTSISLNARSNESGAVRKAELSFFQGGELRKKFEITQTEQSPYIEVKPKTYTIAGDGESFTIEVDTNQPDWNFDLSGVDWLTVEARSATSVTFSAGENNSGRKRTADVLFYATAAPELMDYLELTQNIPAVAPVADMLDVVFDAEGKGKDVSALSMTVDNSRVNSDISTFYSDKFGRYVAKFNNPTIARSSMDAGYYFIPYTPSSTFGSKLADGFTYELVFCSYTDPTAKQVKPFSSTQAGGTGMCFRASTGEINFECHVGGSWVELYSGVLPQKNTYYHVIGTWDKENGIALLYVDGVLTASKNTTGDFKFMDTSVDARWFGIGADPSATDKGEASFYGEVVIARLYDKPVTAEEVKALYKLVK